ncbi:hypothetical protein AQS8620_00212 [Aquimixticola soesokkakensis]|uniref:Uncharacterized protein n=1 Tax=Aquimixticola soesokkakensis TaxID=1519096 RepID=A0A1Y5RCH0_9RHOB|nr:hypothetical protein [Aquimixticola soesokkakensis]SLN14092.1 hypothetical protein AQS8620_00212 [Aquimixticola soesokkakensis]
MFNRYLGALVRAFLVMLLVATPSVALPNVTSDSGQIVALVALFGGALTFFEYTSAYPSLVEFRDAPPFNRIRYVSLLITLLILSAICRGISQPTGFTEFLTAFGALVGYICDFPYSPVRLMTQLLPANAPAGDIALVRITASMAYIISLLSLFVFVSSLTLRQWPSRSGAFNVWINLPTFDPTAGGDVVQRLTRDARFNIAMGFLLPFLVPAFLKAAASIFDTTTLTNSHSLIWTVAAWAFLPASLFMRGIAMRRVADMIAQKRRATYAAAEHDPREVYPA